MHSEGRLIQLGTTVLIEQGCFQAKKIRASVDWQEKVVCIRPCHSGTARVDRRLLQTLQSAAA